MTDRMLKFRVKTATSIFAMTALMAGTVTPAFATIDNTASVNGDTPDGNPAYTAGSEPSDSVSVPVEAATPSYTANKTIENISVASGSDVANPDAGDIITYRVTLVNTGNVTLDNLSVTDPGPTFDGNAADNLGSLTTPTIISESVSIDGELEVGETIVYEFQYTLSQLDVDNSAGVTDGVVNTAVVSADDPQSNSVAPDAGGSDLTAEGTIPSNPVLTLDKEAYEAAFPDATLETGPVSAGEVIFYRFTVVNDGNVTIDNVAISEDAFNGFGNGGVIGTPTVVSGTTSMAPGATTVFEVSYTVTQQDVDNLQ